MRAGWQLAGFGAILWGLGVIWMLCGRLRAVTLERDRERRGREEMEAYTRLDTRMGRDGDVRELGRRVCSVVAARSSFCRVAMLARDAEGRLYIAANEGLDETTFDAIHKWANRVAERERSGGVGMDGGARFGAKSLVVSLGEIGRAVVVPLSTAGGRRMTGALVVRADSLMQVQRRIAEEAISGLEALAAKLGRAMENADLAERLLRTEKLAGLGMLAGGVAHALNNPLTAVLGFAELICETTQEARSRRDAAIIVEEAKRMRATIQRLLDFWRPPVQREEAIELGGLVSELAGACAAKLAARGVNLTIQVADDTPTVRGNRERLRQVLEHLVNNASQAIAKAGTEPDKNAIRLTLSHDTRAVQMIVSDTGPGFPEPNRVFDLFYTTQAPGDGDGLGLSICYGIVREHGGEISAFNLHPRGAAVVVELPVGEVMRNGRQTVTGEVA